MHSRRGSRCSLPTTTVTLSLPDLVVDLETEPGLFSHRRIDVGTELLLHHAPPPPAEGDVLDLGCGYGPVALATALRSPRSRVWAVDTDDLALGAVERNVRRVGISNVTAVTPRLVPEDVRFAAIYSNPPTRVGRQPLLSLLDHWLRRLQRGGKAYLVIKREGGADWVAASLVRAGFDPRRIVAKRGYRVFEIPCPRRS